MTIFQREPLLFSSHVLKKRDIFSHNHGNLFFVHMVGTMWNKKWIKIMCKRLTIFFFTQRFGKNLLRGRETSQNAFSSKADIDIVVRPCLVFSWYLTVWKKTKISYHLNSISWNQSSVVSTYISVKKINFMEFLSNNWGSKIPKFPLCVSTM